MTAALKQNDEILSGIISGDRFVRYDEFFDSARRAATGFRSMGLTDGDTVAILMRNDPDFLVAQTATSLAGLLAVPLNWHASVDDTVYVLIDSGAKALVVHADLYSRIRTSLPSFLKVLVVETPIELQLSYNVPQSIGGVAAGDQSWRDFIVHHQPLSHGEMRAGGSLAISYTSGTTGRPKGVTRPPMDAAAACRAYGIVDDVFGVSRGEPVRVLVSAPVYHGAPNFFANRGAIEGSLAILQPRFDAEDVLRLIDRHKATHVYMVPTTMLKLLELPADVRQRYDLSSLRRVVHSAAPCPRQVKQRMIDWLGPVIYEFYGGTETGTVTILSSDEALQRPGSVGRLLPNCGLKVFDDNGVELRPGEVGEIFARNFNLPHFQYLHLPEKQAEIERDDLVSLGDVGYIDIDGFVYLCDRKRDMVISAGVNIYPAEIESVLLSMKGVADCIVFGIPDPVYGETLCAHVEPATGAIIEPDEVIAFLRNKLATYQVPTKVVVDKFLPREESGKIMKRKVRNLYWSESKRLI